MTQTFERLDIPPELTWQFSPRDEVRCGLASKLSAALQQLSHAECLESLTYKNRAVNPSDRDFFLPSGNYSHDVVLTSPLTEHHHAAIDS